MKLIHYSTHFFCATSLSKKVIFLVVVWFCTTFSFGQTVSQLQKAGDKKISEGDYYAATQYYEKAVQKDADNLTMQYKLAEAYRMYNDYANAAATYRVVYKTDKKNEFPLAAYWLGTMLRYVCDCKSDEAVGILKKFRGKYRKNDFYSSSALQQIESAVWVADNKKPIDSIKIEHLGKEINTEKSEFNAMHVYPDKLQFSALRNIGEEKNEKNLVRIFNQPPALSAIYTPNGANPDSHIGNGNYSTDGLQFFFTQCDNNPATNNRCDIYVTRFENYKWTTTEKLPSTVNDPNATNTHPACGFDANGNEVLFFTSNRNGGSGGMDIWVSKKNADGSYTSAINLGNNINTKGNEITPFYDAASKKLFFSSDWHYGYGGYDIFETNGEYTNWSKPKNLLQPINSAQNDLYYSMATDNSRAYITSNRKGSYFIKSETCCNDIYAYNMHKKLNIADTTSKIEAKIDSTSMELEVKKVSPVVFFNDKLKQMKQLLPVVLYFHNDEPDARTTSDTTNLDYRQTYEAYSALRNEYIREYTKGISKAPNTTAEKEIADWFEQKVDKGYYDLVAFASQTLQVLEAGEKLDITIKAYCSPLNYNAYNIHLGNRRAASLNNFFYHYRDGALLPYIQQGKFSIKNESLGEETASKNISDSREDKKNSVYSPNAAIERRVEIISVEVK